MELSELLACPAAQHRKNGVTTHTAGQDNVAPIGVACVDLVGQCWIFELRMEEEQLPSEAPPTTDWLANIGQDELILLAGLAAAGILFILLLFLVVRRLLSRPVPMSYLPPDDRFIDIEQLDASGPAIEAPVVEVYGVPVRTAIVILAPVGRDGAPPGEEQLPEILNQLVPGFYAAVERDQPLIKIWAGQLSAQGFTHAFFNNVPLPKEKGKGTPWCALAGRFTAIGQSFLAGLVFCSAQPNGLSQFAIQHEGQWNDVLRVRQRAS